MVLHISLDGLRPDAITPETCPFLDQMLRDGLGTRTARTVMPSVTLPCHTSMFRGVPPTRHGITSNVFTPLARPVPSLVDWAFQHGKRAGMFFNWNELRDLCAPPSVAVVGMNWDNQSMEGDTHVADLAIEAMRTQHLDYVFLYLGYIDTAGHRHGWMAPEYLAAASHADGQVRRAVEAAQAIDPEVVVIWMSDHGGHDRGHGTEMPEDMTIPFCLYGRSIPAGDLTDVRIMDCASTVSALLGLEAHPDWEGANHAP